MGLLDLAIQYTPQQLKRASSPTTPDPKKGTLSSSRTTKFASDVARKALNLMVLLRPVTMVTTLAKEVATYLASQHVTHFPHSQLQPVPVGGAVGVVLGVAYLMVLLYSGWCESASQYKWRSDSS